MEYFTLDQNSGRLTVKKPISSSSTASFTVVARAYDLGVPAKDDITTFIVSTDQNQHPPVISPLTYTVTINETHDLGSY